MKTLQEIVQNHKSLDELMIENGGEITNEQQELIVDSWMKEILSDLSNKADGYKIRQDMLASASANLKARAALMSGAAKVLVNMGEALKSRMKFAMLDLNKTEIAGSDFKYRLTTLKPNLDYKEELLDSKYKIMKTVVITEVDEELIRKDLSEGIQVAGAVLKPSYKLTPSANKKVKEIN